MEFKERNCIHGMDADSGEICHDCDLDNMAKQYESEKKELQSKIDTLTLALAEARDILQKNSDEWHDFNKIEPGHSCEAKIRLHAISQRSTLSLSNPTSLRASEEMKGLRKVVEAARLSNKECRKWRSNPDEKPCHEFKSLVDNDLLCHGCRLMNRIEALEAYESRGKV